MKATVNIILDYRTANKDNKYPVKIRVTYNRIPRAYTMDELNYHFTKKEFEKIKKGTNLNPSQEEIYNKFEDCRKEVKAIINRLTKFTFDEFKKHLKKESEIDSTDLLELLRTAAKTFIENEKPGTAATYSQAANSLENYMKKENIIKLTLHHVSVNFLKKYEKWMLKSERSLTTVGIYLRNVRTIFNNYNDNPANESKVFYPFGKRGYKIPTGENVKKALEMDEILKIMAYSPIELTNEHKYRDMWVFSYLSGGMNIADIVRLKYSDIADGAITFTREKTKDTNKKGQTISIPLLDETKNIIELWGVKPIIPESYIFGFISHSQDAEIHYKLTKQLTKNINSHIDNICKKIGIESHVTTYAARHSYATTMSKNGAPIDFIRATLGHKKIETTQNYLGSFKTPESLKYFNNLIGK